MTRRLQVGRKVPLPAISTGNRLRSKVGTAVTEKNAFFDAFHTGDPWGPTEGID
jgi:hypothetical protein